MQTKTFLLLATVAVSAQAHMRLHYPPPLKADNNPHTVEPAGDPDMIYPYGCCGRPVAPPCRGFLNLLGTPEGAPVATWEPGSKQHFNLSGPAPLGGNHYGGSCQVGFSVDKGVTFQVATSFIGNCPHRHGGMDAEGQDFEFTVPEDLPEGEAVFAWTWNNREQEFFMNCAVVDIVSPYGSDDSLKTPSSSTRRSVSATTTPSTQSSPSSSPSYVSLTGCSCDCVGESCTCSCPNPASAAALIKSKTRRTTPVPFNERPHMLFSDIKNGCTSVRTNAELMYPDPGPDVVRGDGEYPLQPPSGNCANTLWAL